MSKLKAVGVKFRQAMDSGQRSGHGRVVLLCYELCEQVWGESPVAEQIKGGVESADVRNEVTQDHCLENSLNQCNSQETQDSENILGVSNGDDEDGDNSEDNGDRRSSDDNVQPLATPYPNSSMNHDGEVQYVSKDQKQ